MHYLVKSRYIFDSVAQSVFAGALEIKDGLVVAVHPWDDYPKNLPIEAYDNQFIVPGFIDAHIHLFVSTLIHAGVLHHVSGATVASVAQQALDLPIVHGWKLGIGWYSSDFGQGIYPDKWSLDAVTGDIPTMLVSGDAHSVWFNSAALEALHITEESLTHAPSGDRLRMNGVLSGVFGEAVAVHYIAQVLQPFHSQITTLLPAYMQALNAMGITAVGDVALTGESADDLVYPKLYAACEPNATVRISYFPTMRHDIQRIIAKHQDQQSDMLQFGGVKQFFDGVTSSHTAFLKEPYATPFDANDCGGPLLPVVTMEELVFLASQHHIPIRIHAIGDRAIQLCLQQFQKALAVYPLPEGRYHTIEHLEVMDWNDLPLVAQSQVVVSVQPSHLLVGYETLDVEVGPQRAAHMFPFLAFKQAGATLAFGTDSPVVCGVTPLQSLYYAVARATTDGLPAGGLMPEQALTLADALTAHTLGAAKALSRTDIGTLSVGRQADFTVISRNLFDLPPQKWLDCWISATYVAGRCVYRDKTLSRTFL